METKTQKEMAEYLFGQIQKLEIDYKKLFNLKQQVTSLELHRVSTYDYFLEHKNVEVAGYYIYFISIDGNTQFTLSLNEFLMIHEVAREMFGAFHACRLCGEGVSQKHHWPNPEDDIGCCYMAGWLTEYEYHLQQMVISDNPVKYAYDYLISKENDQKETV